VSLTCSLYLNFDAVRVQLKSNKGMINYFPLSLCCRHSEPWFIRRGEIAEGVKYLLRKRDLKMRKSIAEVLLSMHEKMLLNSLFINCWINMSKDSLTIN
jgi:hypothetical protein